MKKSVSQSIIDKWLEKLTKSEIDPFAAELLKEMAKKQTLDDAKVLKGAISKIEGKNAENQDSNG